jgi:hypothetical protein
MDFLFLFKPLPDFLVILLVHAAFAAPNTIVQEDEDVKVDPAQFGMMNPMMGMGGMNPMMMGMGGMNPMMMGMGGMNPMMMGGMGGMGGSSCGGCSCMGCGIPWMCLPRCVSVCW